MAQRLTLSKIRIDTLKFMTLHGYTRTEISYIIGVGRSSLFRFLNGERGLQGINLLNLINLLYYDNKTESSL